MEVTRNFCISRSVQERFCWKLCFISLSYIEQQQLAVLFIGSLLFRDGSVLIHKDENPSLGSYHAHKRHANAREGEKRIWGLAHQLIYSNLSKRFETLLSKRKWRLIVRVTLCQPLTSTHAYVKVFILHYRYAHLYKTCMHSHTEFFFFKSPFFCL